MSKTQKPWIVAGVVVFGLVLAWGIWLWYVERVEVQPGEFLVRIKLWGKPLPDGDVVAPDESYQGVQRRLVGEGRHFINPLFERYEIHKVIDVPQKHCLVLTRKAGREIAADRRLKGEFLAQGEFEKDPDLSTPMGEKGVLERVYGPDRYRVHPYEYDAEVVKGVELESQTVGVKVLRYGKEPAKARQGTYVVNDGERGVQKTIVPGGVHLLNPYVADIIPVDVRAHTVVFTDIEFPSQDGFTIQPPVEVRYKVVPEKAAELFVMLCDEGYLPQKDDTPEDQKKNPILQKVVLPLIRGFVRIEGSRHPAREYISKPKEEADPKAKENVKDKDKKDERVYNPRERLQRELIEKVKPECAKVGVEIEYIAVGQPVLNKSLEDLASQIRERENTRVMRKTNQQSVLQYKQEQELKSTEALAEQRKAVVEANTKLEQGKINAERLKEVEKTKLGAKIVAAQSRLEGAKKRAESVMTEGKAQAGIITAENEAQVAELKTAVEGFTSPEQFAQFHVIKKLSPALNEIFASDTSEFAKLFSTYMTPGPRRAGAALPVPRDDARAGGK